MSDLRSDVCSSDLTLDAILLTHHHGHHVGGVRALQAETRARVYGPATGTLPACDQKRTQGDTVALPNFDMQLSVLDIPGHTAGHIAYFGEMNPGKPLVFCGDTLFAEIGRASCRERVCQYV